MFTPTAISSTLHRAFDRLHQGKDELIKASRSLALIGDNRAIRIAGLVVVIRELTAELEEELRQSGVEVRKNPPKS